MANSLSYQDPVTLRLPLGAEKFAYGMGDFGSNLILCIGTLYLLKFYTDILGLPAIYGGVIFLIAKFFTAFTDMLTWRPAGFAAKYRCQRQVQAVYLLCLATGGFAGPWPTSSIAGSA
ncbi:Inner membrane symporter yihP [Serratia fonticola]|uniref:Inner membrane symporter yihP n=1 Tax=Serratia fonticola TaxID=47917 RepID=A0A4U9WNC6_SERFO|nr:Inner membrane symporter yihP [Serratia fonticola]